MVRNFVSACSLFILIFCTFTAVESKEVEIHTIRVDVATPVGILLTEIHFDKKDEINAQRVKKIVENDLVKITEYFGYVPKGIVHINLDPYVQISNGSAVVFPANIINLYQLPPSQSSHLLGINDWLRGVLFHEFIHITHMDLTRGVWNGARSIFGTVAKIPVGAVPSWFTEGIAVWGESHLTEGGRLHYPLFNKEMIVYFLRQNSCQTIDCLDQPGFYPNRALSYIAGAHFLEFVENKRPNTISCLVKKNASKIPFFLDSVFRECTGSGAQNLFNEFRVEFLNSQEPISVENEAWGVKINNKYGVDNFQKGMVFDGEQLFKVEHNRYEEALVSYDIENNLHMATQKYDAPIGEVTQTMSFEAFKDFSEGSSEAQRVKFLMASFLDNPHFRDSTKSWRLLDAQTLTVEKKLNFRDDPQYVLSLGEEDFLTASFKNLRWQIAKETLRSDLAATINFNKLITFDPEFNLHALEIRQDKVFIKYFHNNQYVLAFIKISDLKNNNLKMTKLYNSSKSFSEPLLDSEVVIVSDDQTFDRLIDLSALPFKQYKMNATMLNRVDQIVLTTNSAVVFEERIKANNVSKVEVIKTIKSQSELMKEEIIDNIEVVVPNAIPQINQKVYDYPSWSHFIPHYWFLTTGSSENISSIGAYTEFNDPMYFTHFSLSVLSYPDERKWGGSLSVNHKFQWPSDLLKFNAEINREYFKSNVFNRLNQEHEGIFSLYYNILKDKWVFTPGFFVGYKESNDFIASNSLFNQGLMFSTQYNSLSYHETFQKLFSSLTFQRSEVKNRKEYYVAKVKLDSDLRLSDRFKLDLRSNYTKQFKSDFNRGVAFGGGVSNYLNNRFHQFYGLPYSDAFGNEILTVRAQLDYNVFDVYRGYEFFPVYLKEVHLLLGREIMKADRIIIEGQKILNNKMLTSFFIGPRFDLNVAYYVPVEVEIIFSRMTHSSIEAVNSVEFNFNIKL